MNCHLNPFIFAENNPTVLMKNTVVFASGSGTNAENIIQYFNTGNFNAKVTCVYTNNPNAGVIKRARMHSVPVEVFDRQSFYSEAFVNKLESIDCIVLAGFLWLVPIELVRAFPYKIINIHPALLPKYGGKGIYGDRVHQAVIENKEKQSGITIHYVNEKYDEGEIILQARCQVDKNETPSSLAKKIHQLEYAYFPITIQTLLS